MKTDAYTKAVLTIIAIALTVIVVRDIDIVPKAYASPVPSSYLPINADGSIDVNIKSINGENTVKLELSDEIKVDLNIEEIGGNSIWKSSGLPIVIKK